MTSIRHIFFFGAEPSLADAMEQFIADLNSPYGILESQQDLCAMLSQSDEECADACCESGERIFTMTVECSNGLHPDEIHEELCLAIFEGGALASGLKVISIE